MAKDSLEILSKHTNVNFNVLYNVCVREFGEPRKRGKHNATFTTGLSPAGFRLVNIQDDGNGDAKPYQVDQVVKAITMKREQYGE